MSCLEYPFTWKVSFGTKQSLEVPHMSQEPGCKQRAGRRDWWVLHSQQGRSYDFPLHPCSLSSGSKRWHSKAKPTASESPKQVHCNVYCSLNSHFFFICTRLMKIFSLHGLPPCKLLHKNVPVPKKEQPPNYVSPCQST